MSVVPVEKTFPRGGSKEFSTHPRPSFQSTSLFSAKKPRHIPRNNFDNDNPDSTYINNNKRQKDGTTVHLKKYTGQLTYKGVAEGMLSLGAVFAINDHDLRVILPGNTVATVPITNISETYTTALRNVLANDSKERIASLQEMFKVGQTVVTKVVRKVLENNKNRITLSLDPQQLYSDINLDEVPKGAIVVASVKSIEDKGYVMSLGKSSIRAFLSHEYASNYELTWNDGKKLALGQIVRCYVKKSTTLDSITTLVLSAKPSKVAKANYDKMGSTLESLMPGMKFTATVSNHFPNGIQIQLSDNFVGYVHRDHFEAPFKTPDNYDTGTSVKARVLYILPSGAVYFTLKPTILEASPPTDPYSLIKCGEIITDAKVFSYDSGLIVKVGKHEDTALKGFVPLNQTSFKQRSDFDEFDMPVSQQLAMEFPIQSDITCRIIGYNYLEHYYLCTMDKELMKEKIVNSTQLEVGMVLQCTVKSIELRGIVLNIGKGCRVTGFVPLTHISDVLLSNPEKKYHVGQTVAARVLSLKDGKFVFTMKRLQVQNNDPILSSFEEAAVGDVYTGSVQKVTEKGLLIQFYNFVNGWLPVKYLGTTSENVTSRYSLGQLVPCKIVTKDETESKLQLALRDFEMPAEKEKKEKKKRVRSIEDVEARQHLAEWTVSEKKTEPVVISKRAARKMKKELNKLKRAEKLREKRRKEKTELSKRDLKRLEAKLRRAKRDGITIELDPLESAAVKKLELEKKKGLDTTETEETVESETIAPEKSAKKDKKDKSKAEPEENIQKTEEKAVKRKQAKQSVPPTETEESVESESKKSAKKRKKDKSKAEPEENIQKTEKEVVKHKQAKQTVPSTETEETAKSDSKKSAKKRKKDKSEAEPEEKKQKTEEEVLRPKPVEVQLPKLAVPNGFTWDATPSLLPVMASMREQPDSSDEEEAPTVTRVKKTRQMILNEKRIQAQQEEARLRKIEQRLMDEDAPPQSANEFDRLVLSSPDSSIIWMQYMAYHLQATEIEKARNIGLRALKTISFREEKERLNVWCALLNLENLYGSKENLESTFEEAVKNNNDLEIHLRMLVIYGDSSKFEEGDKLIASMCKKFKYEKDMWYTAAVFYMKSSQAEKARALLPRALGLLDQKDHIDTITKFALLENTLGSKERAQTLMEQVLTSYPKRVDVWSRYVDMLVKSNLIPLARQVLERAVCQRMPSHKMKTLFKKFLAFEEAHGTDEDTQKVRQLALEYVESAGYENGA